ncbi:MAG TPA: serine hydrolase [Anaerolineaceae bacterium]|nr:serine hydrolase [Anaerolineaceae bacterium]
MRNRSSLSVLRWVALILIFSAVLLTVFQLIRFSRVRGNYPSGQVIAGIPVGGLDRSQAAQRLIQAYSQPVEIHYANAVIQFKPSVVGFELGLESMLSAADLQRASEPFWADFWNYLWNRSSTPGQIPLLASISEDRLRAYLRSEIAPRYDRPPSPALPVPGTVNFQSGEPGTTLDVDRAVILIEDALKSPTARVVNLSVQKTSAPRLSLDNLQILIQQIMAVAKYDGLAEIYLKDLQTSEELHFAYDNGKNVEPDIAFTAASTMKLPVMVSVFRQVSDPPPQEVVRLVTEMIDLSDNDSTDRVARNVIDKDKAPLKVSEDLQTLGLKNTFWGGFFAPGSPLLTNFKTPANQRTDISANPDIYSQTTPLEMGLLLDDIYQCAQTGGGTLPAAFPGQISQAKCQEMITVMTGNHIGVLLQAGLPDGTLFAHKHGWVTEFEDGLIHNIADVGIVYSPGGNYIIAIYLNHPTQLVFDPVNQMVAQISTAIYNFYNSNR